MWLLSLLLIVPAQTREIGNPRKDDDEIIPRSVVVVVLVVTVVVAVAVVAAVSAVVALRVRHVEII